MKALPTTIWLLPCRAEAAFPTRGKAIANCEYHQIMDPRERDCGGCKVKDRRPRKFVLVEKKK